MEGSWRVLVEGVGRFLGPALEHLQYMPTSLPQVRTAKGTRDLWDVSFHTGAGDTRKSQSLKPNHLTLNPKCLIRTSIEILKPKPRKET